MGGPRGRGEGLIWEGLRGGGGVNMGEYLSVVICCFAVRILDLQEKIKPHQPLFPPRTCSLADCSRTWSFNEVILPTKWSLIMVTSSTAS